MPKSMRTRRRKNILKDFQKVKLKAGTTLPKGLNVTDASFKSRQIQIREQLTHAQADEPQTHRKLNISALLSQLQHYNISIRRDAATGLHEIIQSNPQVLQQHLSTILERSAALFVDKESTVRQASLKLCQLITVSVPTNQIAPFFKLIIAHLCCAMTHIEQAIQADSMKIVDLFLGCYPALLVKHSSELLPNFISLISKKSQSKSASLAIDPSRKISAQKWRTVVLDRLHALLTAVANQKEDNGPVTSVDHDVTVDPRLCNVDGVTSSFYRPIGAVVGFQSQFRFGVSQQTGNYGNLFSNPEQLDKFIHTLVPLLLQSWVECSSAKYEGSTLRENLITNMTSILKVAQLLWRCFHGNDNNSERAVVTNSNARRDESIMERYGAKFQQHFMADFPYTVQESVQRNKKTKHVKIEKVSTVDLNLRVCDVMSFFTPPAVRDTNRENWYQKLLDYITSLKGQQIKPDETRLLLEILEQLLKGRNDEAFQVVVTCVSSMYKNGRISAVERHLLHEFMLNQVLPRRDLVSLPAIQQWMQSLPAILLSTNRQSRNKRAAMSPLVRLMSVLAAQKQDKFLQSMQDNLEEILEVGLLSVLADSDQRQFLEILYHFNDVTSDLLMLLLRHCRLATTSSVFVRYLVELVDDRMTSSEDYCSLADYFNFMLSLTVFVTRKPLAEEKEEEKLHQDSDWLQYKSVVEVIYERLRSYPNRRQILLILQTFIQRYHAANALDSNPRMDDDNTTKNADVTANTTEAIFTSLGFCIIITELLLEQKVTNNLNVAAESDDRKEKSNLEVQLLTSLESANTIKSKRRSDSEQSNSGEKRRKTDFGAKVAEKNLDDELCCHLVMKILLVNDKWREFLQNVEGYDTIELLFLQKPGVYTHCVEKLTAALESQVSAGILAQSLLALVKPVPLQTLMKREKNPLNVLFDKLQLQQNMEGSEELAREIRYHLSLA